MYEMSQRHPVWVTENHINPCNSVASDHLGKMRPENTAWAGEPYDE